MARLKYLSLGLLVVQNTFLAILISASRRTDQNSLYISSSVVFVMEWVKLTICVIVLLVGPQPLGKLRLITFQQDFRMAVPALLYAIQNNLLYLALSNLDPVTFQIIYQFKIVTTAIFSVLLLGTRLSFRKCSALFILTLGVILVQLDVQYQKPLASISGSVGVGLAAVIISCLSSGFAGVYHEKSLKSGSLPLEVQNIRFGIWGLGLSAAAMLLHDSDQIFNLGLFYGYNWLTGLVILLQASGGLITSLVMKYADNISKGFAASISIVTSSLLGSIFLELETSFQFIIGAGLVVGSTLMYTIT